MHERDRIRVLHVSSDSNFAGAGRYILTLLLEPVYRDNVHVEVAAPMPGALWDELGEHNIRRTALGGGDRSIDPVQLPKLCALIRSNRYQIVHTHGSLTARIAARLVSSTRIVATKHTMGTTGGRALSLVQNLLADKIICPSRAVLNELESAGVDRRKLALVYSGIDTRAFTQQVRGQYERPIIMCSGRLEPEKGHRYLISAMPEVLSSIPSAELWLAGEGSQRDSLEHLAHEVGCAQNVRFLGFRRDIPALLAKTTLFVLPSCEEAFGLSLLEAMASALAVVATDTGGIPEIITHMHDGLLVPARSPKHIADAVVSILKQPELQRKLAHNAALTAKQRFGSENQARMTLQCYREALRSGEKVD
jgi:glycosyltransferase involved in cell wall biosynthesis